VSVKRSCLMMSDLQSGAETVEYALWSDYLALAQRCERMEKALIDILRTHGPYLEIDWGKDHNIPRANSTSAWERGWAAALAASGGEERK
jgi:hypothetical protein